MKKIRALLFIIGILASDVIHAQMLVPGNEPSILSMSMCLPDSSNPFACLTNPANVTMKPNRSFGVTYLHPYMLKEVKALLAGAVIVGNDFNIGFFYRRNQFDLYHEGYCILNFSKRLHQKMLIGMQIGFSEQKLQLENASMKPMAKIGLLIHQEKRLKMGIALTQLFKVDATANMFNFPTVCEAGVGILVSEEFDLSLDFRKAAGMRPDVKIGMQYKPQKILSLKWGIEILSAIQSGGLFFEYHNISVGIIAEHHPILGFSPGLSVYYVINRNQ